MHLSNKTQLPDNLIKDLIVELSRICTPEFNPENAWFYISNLRIKRLHVRGFAKKHKVPLWYKCNLFIPSKKFPLTGIDDIIISQRIIELLSHELQHIADVINIKIFILMMKLLKINSHLLKKLTIEEQTGIKDRKK